MGSFSPYDPAQPTILTVPGLGGSGPSHWQSLWESARPDTVRVELGMWNTPHRNAWVTKLDQAISAAQAPVILAAHSLGCLAVAWWAELTRQPYGWPVAGALLVAPADVDRPDAQDDLKAFRPSPTAPLHLEHRIVGHRLARLVDLAVAEKHEAGHNQRLGAGPAFGQAAID